MEKDILIQGRYDTPSVDYLECAPEGVLCSSFEKYGDACVNW